MWKNKLLLIALVLLAVVAGLIALFDKPSDEEVKSVPAEKVVIPTRINEPFFSDTGAKDEPMSDDEYRVGQLINKFRNVCPVNNEFFVVDFDYKIDKFVVYIKDYSEKNRLVFQKYLEDAGYIEIPSSWFVYTNNVYR
ncbi:hypothetical protein HYV64_03805 [Candidatus Shapirobacteria bacterium]|nr:hypothetical protein [Candidatus Shapirobacteria bacterium]